MGNKGAKPASKKPTKLSSKDVSFLSKQTGMSKDEIGNFFEKFSANNPDGVLDKKEFVTLYASLRTEPLERIDEIALHVFNAFDSDNNGSISFSEFLV